SRKAGNREWGMGNRRGCSDLLSAKPAIHRLVARERGGLRLTDSPFPIPDSRLPFSWPTRVYWEDTDAGGVVYHAQYLAFLERARTEWLRALGYGQEPLRVDHGLVFAVRAMRIDFRAPARLDDALDVSVA